MQLTGNLMPSVTQNIFKFFKTDFGGWEEREREHLFVPMKFTISNKPN